MNDTAALSTLLADAVAAVAGRIVRVEGRRRGAASGFVWTDGLIVTADHVVPDDTPVTVGLPDGTRLEAEVAGRDLTTDVALLRVAQAGPAQPPSSDQPRVGQLVLAVARPGGAVRAAHGIVAASEGPWRTGAGGSIDAFVQADLTMYPGYSGGALVGADATIYGMVTSGLVRGANVAVPNSTLARVVQSLSEHGHVRRGYLGVSSQPAALPSSAAQELEQKTGLLLTAVDAGGPAAAAGLHMGDVLVRFDDQPTRHFDDLAALLTGDRVGQSVNIRFLRAGALGDAAVTVGERPAP